MSRIRQWVGRLAPSRLLGSRTDRRDPELVPGAAQMAASPAASVPPPAAGSSATEPRRQSSPSRPNGGVELSKARAAADEPLERASANGSVTEPADSLTNGNHRFLGIVVGLAAAGLALALVHEYRSFIAPIFFTLNLMITAYPLYQFMVRHKVPRMVASVVSGLVVIAVLMAFLYGMYWSIVAMVNKLPDYQDQFNEFYVQAAQQLQRFGVSEEAVLEQIKKINPQSLAGVAGNLLSDLGSVGAMLIVMVTALIFMIMDAPEMSERLQIIRGSHRRFTEALSNFAEGIRRYWVVATVFGLIVAILDGAVLIGLGVPLALVWAVFSLLTNYIPNIGFVIGLIPPATLALFDKGPRTAIAVVVAYSVLNFVVQSIIQPKVAGNAVGLTPTLSFLSLLLWTAVLGPLGALLALPASLLVKALLIDADPNARWVNALISSRPQDAINPEPVEDPNYTRADD